MRMRRNPLSRGDAQHVAGTEAEGEIIRKLLRSQNRRLRRIGKFFERVARQRNQLTLAEVCRKSRLSVSTGKRYCRAFGKSRRFEDLLARMPRERGRPRISRENLRKLRGVVGRRRFSALQLAAEAEALGIALSPRSAARHLYKRRFRIRTRRP